MFHNSKYSILKRTKKLKPPMAKHCGQTEQCPGLNHSGAPQVHDNSTPLAA